MFARLLSESFWRQKRRKAVALAAVALGTAVASALANLALDVSDKVSRELRSFGANLVVFPAGGGSPLVFAGQDLTRLRVPAYLSNADVLKVKENFWRNNILDFAPVLEVAASVGGQPVRVLGTWFERSVPLEGGQRVVTGARRLHPFWRIEGEWPDEGRDEALVGRALARRLDAGPGGTLRLEVGARPRDLTVAGVLAGGADEDEAVLAPLEIVQALGALEGKVDRVLVSALTTPESAVYERLAKNPRELPAEELEKWACTPFVSSIAYAISTALPGAEVRAIRRVADSEGKVLRKIQGLMMLVALTGALAAALTMTSALTTGVLGRRDEIGLLKALGAGNGVVVALFLSEVVVLALAGGLLGGISGALIGRWITLSVFGSPGVLKPLALPIAMAAALMIALSGVAIPVRWILRLEAAEALRG